MPLIKLADFGWAAIVGPARRLERFAQVDRMGVVPEIPPEGVGSLWYAPPELNPPVSGAEIVMDEVHGGKSDMWRPERL